MKKLILCLIVGFVAFALFARMRLFMRDPLASVTHNGVKEDGAQVYINYANDVLIENDHAPMYVLLIQHGNNIGLPSELHCLHLVACLTDADQASLSGGWNITVDEMSRQFVRYHSAKKDAASDTVITLY
jgi:hypothetical protein